MQTIADKLERKLYDRIFVQSKNSSGKNMVKYSGNHKALISTGKLKSGFSVDVSGDSLYISVPHTAETIEKLETKYGEIFSLTKDELIFLEDTIIQAVQDDINRTNFNPK